MTKPYEKHLRWLGLSVQKGTPPVPDDGKYHLMDDGEIVYSTANEAIALAQLEVREEEKAAANPQLTSPRELLRRESAFSDIMGVKGDAKTRRTSQEQAKGGKGGRSGV